MPSPKIPFICTNSEYLLTCLIRWSKFGKCSYERGMMTRDDRKILDKYVGQGSWRIHNFHPWHFPEMEAPFSIHEL